MCQSMIFDWLAARAMKNSRRPRRLQAVFFVTTLAGVCSAPLSCVDSAKNEGVSGTAGAGSQDTGPRYPADCSLDDAYELLMIDDFEFGAAAVAFTNNEVCYRCSLQSSGGAGAERSGASSCEEDCRASQTPRGSEKPLAAELLPEPRCESRYALHLQAGPFTEWGGLVGFPFAPGLDVSNYEGVSFWGRVKWETRSTVRLSVLDPGTDSAFVDDAGESLCDAESSLDDFEQACDPYGRYAVMTGDWKFFRIPFHEMRQKGFGAKTPYLDLGVIRQVTVDYGQGEWDFWIDDLAFYRKTENP